MQLCSSADILGLVSINPSDIRAVCTLGHRHIQIPACKQRGENEHEGDGSSVLEASAQRGHTYNLHSHPIGENLPTNRAEL